VTVCVPAATSGRRRIVPGCPGRRASRSLGLRPGGAGCGDPGDDHLSTAVPNCAPAAAITDLPCVPDSPTACPDPACTGDTSHAYLGRGPARAESPTSRWWHGRLAVNEDGREFPASFAVLGRAAASTVGVFWSAIARGARSTDAGVEATPYTVAGSYTTLLDTTTRPARGGEPARRRDVGDGSDRARRAPGRPVLARTFRLAVRGPGVTASRELAGVGLATCMAVGWSGDYA
jgi:hypothetical protein